MKKNPTKIEGLVVFFDRPKILLRADNLKSIKGTFLNLKT